MYVVGILWEGQSVNNWAVSRRKEKEHQRRSERKRVGGVVLLGGNTANMVYRVEEVQRKEALDCNLDWIVQNWRNVWNICMCAVNGVWERLGASGFLLWKAVNEIEIIRQTKECMGFVLLSGVWVLGESHMGDIRTGKATWKDLSRSGWVVSFDFWLIDVLGGVFSSTCLSISTNFLSYSNIGIKNCCITNSKQAMKNHLKLLRECQKPR